ncbi:MAG: chemotaxis protein CheW [Herminiimonas sp.]|nr:chemotaxis protein CheW [Herminiimonas sp.]
MTQQLLLTTAPSSGTQHRLLSPTQALSRGFSFSDSPHPSPLAIPTAPLLAATGTPSPGVQARQGFRIGSLNLMIGYADGSELAEMPVLYRIPNAPGWFCGMANLHGVLTPVFDLSTYLEVDRNSAAKPMLLVLSQGANAAGVVIDGLPQRLRWSIADQVDIATAPARLVPYLRAACSIGGELYFDLQCDALLNAIEQALENSH